MRAREAEVFDLGYQRYTGPREGRNRARLALFENGVRTVLGIGRGGRAKILPVGLFLAVITPAVVFVTILAFLDPIAGDDATQFIPGPADYYSIVSVILIIFGAIMAPELLCPDRRDNVLPLYLVRPLTSTDYLIARFLAFFAIVLVLVYAGQIVLQAGLILTAGDQVDYIRDNWQDVPRILFMGALIATFISVGPLAVAAFTTRRAYAAAFIIAAWLLLNSISDGLTFQECISEEFMQDGGTVSSTTECTRPVGDLAPYIGLLNLGGVTDNLNNMVFDVDIEPGEGSPSSMAVAELHDAFPIGVYVLWTGIPALLLWHRYRRIRL
ncbi:MAG: ABC transporter permease subunit [Chloroflexi bacterium]|nr:ABC transporter permease subunit [Chloroflexota bacterium]MYB84758.1 ABC transporter permease subunit [Chloroflexota bacterium]